MMIKGILVLMCFSAVSSAGTPVWTFKPLTATSISVPSNATTVVQYTVTNQSRKSHTLVMNSIKGVSQDTSGSNCNNPFTLGYQESCTLKLNITGSQLSGNHSGGPVVCQQASNSFQCYQPNTSNILNINKAITQFAYVPNLSSSVVYKCDVNSNTGDLSNCTTTGSGFVGPNGIALNQSLTRAYVTNYSTTTVQTCSLNKDTGVLGNCISTGSGFSGPNSIALSPDGVYAYITNFYSGTISLCNIATTGALNNCVAALNILAPRFLAFNPSNGFAYITNGDNVTKCVVNNANGNLSSCTNTGSGFYNAGGIAFNLTGTYAYVTSSNNTVSICSVDSNGYLTNCTNTGDNFSAPWRITINSTSTFAYITNETSYNVTICSINADSGLLSNCASTANGYLDGYGNVALT